MTLALVKFVVSIYKPIQALVKWYLPYVDDWVVPLANIQVRLTTNAVNDKDSLMNYDI